MVVLVLIHSFSPLNKHILLGRWESQYPSIFTCRLVSKPLPITQRMRICPTLLGMISLLVIGTKCERRITISIYQKYVSYTPFVTPMVLNAFDQVCSKQWHFMGPHIPDKK